jgi:hypothetical protein
MPHGVASVRVLTSQVVLGGVGRPFSAVPHPALTGDIGGRVIDAASDLVHRSGYLPPVASQGVV